MNRLQGPCPSSYSVLGIRSFEITGGHCCVYSMYSGAQLIYEADGHIVIVILRKQLDSRLEVQSR